MEYIQFLAFNHYQKFDLESLIIPTRYEWAFTAQ